MSLLDKIILNPLIANSFSVQDSNAPAYTVYQTIVQLTKKLNDCIDTINTNLSEFDVVNNHVTELNTAKEQIAQLQADVNNLNNNNITLNDLHTTVDNMQDIVNTVQSLSNSNKQEIEGLKIQIQTLQNTVNALDNIRTEANTVTALQNEIVTARNGKTDLNTRLNTFLLAITKTMVEAVLTGNITTHSHTVSFPVSSVNGKTGTVSLTYSDVGAKPSTYAPTKAEIEAVLTGNITTHSHTVSFPVSSVNGKTGTVNLNYSDVGARPASYTPTKAEIELALTGNITSHSHSAYLTSITKAMVEAVLTGNITTHTHSAYLTSITKAMVEAVLTGEISTHTHAYLTKLLGDSYYIKQSDVTIASDGNGSLDIIDKDIQNSDINFYTGTNENVLYISDSTLGNNVANINIATLFLAGSTPVVTETISTLGINNTVIGTVTRNNITKHGKIVILDLFANLTGGYTIAGNALIGTIPTGFRPTYPICAGQISQNNKRIGSCYINTIGGLYLYLDNSYPTLGTSPININVTFTI